MRCDDHGGAISLTGYDRASISGDDPTTARAESRREFEIVRDGVSIRISAEVDLSCTGEAFGLAVRMSAREDQTNVWDKTWEITIPRDHL